MHRSCLSALLAAGLLCGAACGGSNQETPSDPSGSAGAGSGKADQVTDASTDSDDAQPEPVGMDWNRDILSTELSLDIEGRKGTARLKVAAAKSSAASFEVKGLKVTNVIGVDGPLRYVVTDGRLDVETPQTEEPIEIEVEYGFSEHNDFDGYMSSGVTFLWPYFCSNLFPCKSAPDDGLTFKLAVTGVPADKTAVFPSEIAADAPSYMPAIAIGNYTYEQLGTTAAGTKVGVWFKSGGKTAAMAGTKFLSAAFDWFEKTYGPYTFGNDVASVAASWGPGAFGGMEHHPYWHVGEGAMNDIETHVHEAAHGWYGDGVRIRCWEDFVLSEGTTSYITARGIAAAGGATEEAKLWQSYQDNLEYAVKEKDTPAWPATCNAIDLLHHPLWSLIPYMKGAFFYKAVAEQVGVEKLDKVLADFYKVHVGKAAAMQDMIDAIKTDTGFDPTPLSESWLRGMGIPN